MNSFKLTKFKPIKPEKIATSIRLDASMLNTLDKLAAAVDISRNEMIVRCITYALENYEADDETTQ